MDQIAKSQIEKNEQYGKNLVRIAWAIEIVAASIGLFIGISSAYTTIGYYSDLDESVRTGSVFTNVFIGAAPFIIIAAVELTKIPLTLGFYRTKRFIWRTLFLVTLFMLVFVTFETLFNGLERNFSALESKIQTPRTAYQEQQARLANIEQTLQEINSRTVEDIDEEYAIKLNEIEDDRSKQLDNLNTMRDGELSEVTTRIQNVSKSFEVVADATGLQQSVNRIRQDIEKAQNDAIALIEKENALASEQLQNISIQIQKIDENMTLELTNKGFLQSAASIRSAADKIRQPLIDDRNRIQNELKARIAQIESERDKFIQDKNQELEKTESDLTQSQGARSGILEKNLAGLQKQTNDISDRYAKRTIELNALIDKRIQLTESQREEAKAIQKSREESIPSLEKDRLGTREMIIRLENQINTVARDNNIYRITARFYDRESAAEIKVEELKVVTSIWFGSIALIAALVGPILALAGFILQDPESYKPTLNRKRPFINAARGILLRLRKFYKNRRTGVIRTTFRALIIDIRKWFRAPKIKFKEIKVPHEVIKEVPGPEKVVYKEVPKEVVKNEIVYVPLYSVEDGVVMKTKNINEKGEIKDE
ncbi:MAG: hypothetical protein O3B09_03365 [Proteobacteria bacterium]|nr:hypothetical protein [Pseudomonadota bacterium]